jgi:hypothetical protein
MYYIHANMNDIEDDNADLIVEAESLDQAESLWRKYYELDKDEGCVLNIFKLPPLIGEPRVVEWSDHVETWAKTQKTEN